MNDPKNVFDGAEYNRGYNDAMDHISAIRAEHQFDEPNTGGIFVLLLGVVLGLFIYWGVSALFNSKMPIYEMIEQVSTWEEEQACNKSGNLWMKSGEEFLCMMVVK